MNRIVEVRQLRRNYEPVTNELRRSYEDHMKNIRRTYEQVTNKLRTSYEELRRITKELRACYERVTKELRRSYEVIAREQSPGMGKVDEGPRPPPCLVLWRVYPILVSASCETRPGSSSFTFTRDFVPHIGTKWAGCCEVRRIMSNFATSSPPFSRHQRMVGRAGFEPATSRLSAGCSNQAKLQAHGKNVLGRHARQGKPYLKPCG